MTWIFFQCGSRIRIRLKIEWILSSLSTALDVYILQYGIFSTTLHFTSGQLFTTITWLISAPYINQSTFGIVLDGIIFFLTTRVMLCTNYNTVILVRSVIKFSDRNFLFIAKVYAFLDLILVSIFSYTVKLFNFIAR